MKTKTKLQNLSLAALSSLLFTLASPKSFAENASLEILTPESQNAGVAEINAEQLVNALLQSDSTGSSLENKNLLSALNDVLQPHEKEKLLAKLNEGVKAQKKQAALVLNQAEMELKKIKESRKELQASRLSGGEKSDLKVSKKLFENVLAESNLAARTENALNEISESSAVKVRFLVVKDQTQVVSLSNKKGTLWNSEANREVAQF